MGSAGQIFTSISESSRSWSFLGEAPARIPRLSEMGQERNYFATSLTHESVIGSLGERIGEESLGSWNSPARSSRREHVFGSLGGRVPDFPSKERGLCKSVIEVSVFCLSVCITDILDCYLLVLLYQIINLLLPFNLLE